MPVTSISQLDLSKTYTYADYLTWQLKERLELLRGKISPMPPAPNLEHQRISGRLFLNIATFLGKSNCEVFSAPFDVRLRRKDQAGDDQKIFTVVQPDLCVVCDPSILDQRGCNGAPDLVVEILSPGNSKRELRDKFELYEETGVKEYWIVYPEQRSVNRFILNEEGIFVGLRPLSEEEILETKTLPEIKIDLASIFTLPNKN